MLLHLVLLLILTLFTCTTNNGCISNELSFSAVENVAVEPIFYSLWVEHVLPKLSALTIHCLWTALRHLGACTGSTPS